jgi:hypothetical protein
MNKEHILNEIRRTTESNGGVPLGKDRFYLETGIQEKDWFGRHWARWGDAVREAGFSPNELQKAFGEEMLLNKYISIIREFGHIPVKGELILKRRKDVTIPHWQTFHSRFGSKSRLIEQLMRYCENRPDHEDILRLCKEWKPQNDEVEAAVTLSDAGMGFVYLIKSGRHYKIGRTNALGRREYELAIQLPEKATTVHIIKTDDPAGIEAYWHKRFESFRKNGEWFELNAEQLSAFKRRKFM